MKMFNLSRATRFLRWVLPAAIVSKFKPHPMWVHLFVTRRCNLSCEYCYLKDNRHSELSTEDMKKVIDHLRWLGVRFLAFMGGEPTLRKDFVELVAHAHAKKMFTHVSTNGTLLTAEYIEKLALAGIAIVNVSVDSVLEFDTSRKDCARSRAALNDLLVLRDRYKIEINVNIVLSRANVATVIQTLEHLNGLKITTTIGIINGNTYDATEMDPTLFFSTSGEKQQAFDVLDQIIEFRKQGYNIIEPVEYFQEAKSYLAGNHRWDCGALRHFFSVDCDGKFQICAGVKSEAVDVLSVGRDYYPKYRQTLEDLLVHCNRKCFGNCYYLSTHYIRRPLSLVKQLLG